MTIARECAWFAGCVLVATALSLTAIEYGLSTAPFVTVLLYVLTGVVRLVLYVCKRCLG